MKVNKLIKESQIIKSMTKKKFWVYYIIPLFLWSLMFTTILLLKFKTARKIFFIWHFMNCPYEKNKINKKNFIEEYKTCICIEIIVSCYLYFIKQNYHIQSTNLSEGKNYFLIHFCFIYHNFIVLFVLFLTGIKNVLR